MLNIAYTHASVVLVIFHYYMLQNKQSNRYSLLRLPVGRGGVVNSPRFCFFFICQCRKLGYLS